MKNKKRIIFLMVFILAAFSAAGIYLFRNETSGYVFETVKVEKGSVNITITATGTLEATNTVIVGTQVSGVIEKIYVDFNSVVKKGQLIAELDKSTLQSSLETVEADLERAQAEYEYQETNLERIKQLFENEVLPKSDYDMAVYSFKISKAGLKSAEANLDRAQLNLSYAMIYAPIDGIVLNRAVEEGQTVAASMNTPELFTITNDLSTMQVEADVDEADIGMVEKGQRVEFTVDAFSDDTFSGQVAEVRLQPNESSNVITYTVIVTVANPKLKLKPGMTATITDFVEEANDVLTMAGKAIRFQPERESMKEYMSSLTEGSAPPMPGNKEPAISGSDIPSSPPSGPPTEELAENQKRVWIKDGAMIKPVIVEIGINDGSKIEIVSGLEEGDLVVTSMEKVSGSSMKETKTTEETSSPFVQEHKGGGGGPPR
ncbi:MAG: efflux RND transporter periplasmic adaptor subunit [Clostridia bacterium]|nr:efflux RND transporter periplasmic adaptor subunit [Clostridia bacterium]